ncbi:MAG TPA: nodulation protein NfeD [Casimicrobiaceae bacterium]
MKLLPLVAFASLALTAGRVNAAPPTVLVLPFAGAIGPATAQFVTRGIERADKEDAQLVILQIDTPGGLDTSMREIIKAILASRVPVAVFVGPSGARAASAGTYILYASHIAAMAPGTNLGAATPIQIGMPSPSSPPKSPDKDKDKSKAGGESRGSEDTLTRKQTNDAAAYIRGLAQLRGRNADWGERAVREAVSLSADEALAQHVIDLTARDVPDLVAKVDGRKVMTSGGERTLATSGANIVTLAPDWKSRFLAIITEPSVALILMLIGVYGLFFEFSNPGWVLPGVVGGIALLVGLFALNMLPINYAGLALILLGLAFIVAEAFFPTYGSLGVGGVIAFSIGAIMLIDTDVPGFGVPLWLIASMALISAAFVFVVAGLALRARQRPIVTGPEELIGAVGVALEDVQAEGWARVHSEQWRVQSPVPLKRGQNVRVTGRQGLVLTVAPLERANEGA